MAAATFPIPAAFFLLTLSMAMIILTSPAPKLALSQTTFACSSNPCILPSPPPPPANNCPPPPSPPLPPPSLPPPPPPSTPACVSCPLPPASYYFPPPNNVPPSMNLAPPPPNPILPYFPWYYKIPPPAPSDESSATRWRAGTSGGVVVLVTILLPFQLLI